MNDVKLSGNLCADPEMRYTQGGKPVCNGRLASNKKWKDNEGNQHESTVFIDFDCWGGWAESLGRCSKGDQVVVTGELKLDEWSDRKSVV